MFESMHTIAVYVSDMERATKFYTDILGFQIRVELGSTLSFLKSGNVHVYLEAGHKSATVDNKSRACFMIPDSRSQPDTPTTNEPPTMRAKGCALSRRLSVEVVRR